MPDPNSHIQAHKAELHTLCRTYGVERLALFGSGPSEIEFAEYERDLMVRRKATPSWMRFQLSRESSRSVTK